MNRLLFMRLVFMVLLAGPMLCLANANQEKINQEEMDMHNGVNTELSIDLTKGGVNVRANSLQALQSSISFALTSLFAHVRGTLVSTFELVVGVLSYVFLTAGSELANDLRK